MKKRKPDFFIVGAAKSGTTSLYEYLKKHPTIYLPENKEPHFFGDKKPSEIFVDNKEAYYKLFCHAPENSVIGEASTSYLYSEKAAMDIKKFNPNGKIIILLRNPVDRAYSMYRHQVRDGFETNTFEKGLELEKERIYKGMPYGYHYFEGGLYYRQIKNYLNVFGPENVKIIIFEEFKETPIKVLKEIFAYLNVKDINIDKIRVYNVSNKPISYKLQSFLVQYHPVKSILKIVLPSPFRKKIKSLILKKNMTSSYDKISDTTRKYLIHRYSDDIKKVEKILKRDLSVWKK
ncbi:sulfotransferase family protein [Gracilibacillus kekensis]|uniref:Sulfotransferase domain-containing protein n=1 Tax=Gracilibacillus kekensis TaxID=1027249 RepID=A0A1M7K1P3_9BACI|nr:sulfotransferase [Gracilibacillus kekensis]SHM59210.1 Sulfotransferase domain-containing protein [Gracilibacillus kekensis]